MKKKKTQKYATVSTYSSEEYKDDVLRKKGLNTIEKKMWFLYCSKETFLKSNVSYTEIKQLVRGNKL